MKHDKKYISIICITFISVTFIVGLFGCKLYDNNSLNPFLSNYLGAALGGIASIITLIYTLEYYFNSSETQGKQFEEQIKQQQYIFDENKRINEELDCKRNRPFFDLRGSRFEHAGDPINECFVSLSLKNVGMGTAFKIEIHNLKAESKGEQVIKFKKNISASVGVNDKFSFSFKLADGVRNDSVSFDVSFEDYLGRKYNQSFVIGLHLDNNPIDDEIIDLDDDTADEIDKKIDARYNDIAVLEDYTQPESDDNNKWKLDHY